MKQKPPVKEEHPKAKVLGLLLMQTKILRRGAQLDVARHALDYEEQFLKDLEELQQANQAA